MKTFLISDTHFGHNNCYIKFKDECGNSIRPWASNSDEGDQYLIDMWNSVVGQNDKVYHLGDVAIPRKGLKVLYALNGRKVLIRGTHDIFKLNEYAEHFYDIRGTHKLDRFILSHIPIHPESLARWANGNIHGHLHNNVVVDKFGKPDNKYTNVSVEQLKGIPVDFEEIRERVLNGK
jgi:calcineurin-like phosphoesterase family protein